MDDKYQEFIKYQIFNTILKYGGKPYNFFINKLKALKLKNYSNKIYLWLFNWKKSIFIERLKKLNFEQKFVKKKFFSKLLK